MRYLLLFCFMPMAVISVAQVVLPYSINQPNIPQDQDLIQAAPVYIDSSNAFTSSGFQVGQTVADFTLYDTSGMAVMLSNVLSQNKPVLLVTVSYSCPASRHSMIYVLPDLHAMFGNQVNIMLIYVVDAHPIAPDVCPYSGTVIVPSQNYTDSVLIRQDTLYGGRKTRLKQFMQRYSPNIPCVVDDTANNYWLNFGPSPNNAYLLLPTGEVYSKYGWFDPSKHLIIQDINALFSTNSVNDKTENETHLFPVPANNEMVYSTSVVIQSYEILDLDGRIIITGKTNSSLGKINTSGFDNGVYFIRMEDAEGRMSTSRFIIAH